ncbi:MAG: hypothetical protein ACD_20C00336G0001, partial [uncultured bacterium]
MEWEKIRRMRLVLQAQVGQLTWHILMEAFQARSSETGDELSSSIAVDVISGNTHWDDTTPNSHAFYSTSRQGHLYIGSHGGYYGKRVGIEADLKAAKALALTADELPQGIDVYKTMAALTQTFLEGKFEPPQFTIPTDRERQKLPQRIQRLPLL